MRPWQFFAVIIATMVSLGTPARAAESAPIAPGVTATSTPTTPCPPPVAPPAPSAPSTFTWNVRPNMSFSGSKINEHVEIGGQLGGGIGWFPGVPSRREEVASILPGYLNLDVQGGFNDVRQRSSSNTNRAEVLTVNGSASGTTFLGERKWYDDAYVIAPFGLQANANGEHVRGGSAARSTGGVGFGFGVVQSVAMPVPNSPMGYTALTPQLSFIVGYWGGAAQVAHELFRGTVLPTHGVFGYLQWNYGFGTMSFTSRGIPGFTGTEAPPYADLEYDVQINIPPGAHSDHLIVMPNIHWHALVATVNRGSPNTALSHALTFGITVNGL